jgi:hypothetical protein
MYGAGYDAANQTAYLDQMLRWGLDWAMRVSVCGYGGCAWL